MQKGLYYIIYTSAIWQHINAAHATNYISSPSPNHKKNWKKEEPHKRAYLSENGGLVNKKSGEWAK